MNDESASALDIADQVQSAWSKFDAVPVEDMEYFTRGWGKRIEHLFVGVKPSDVNIEDGNFLIEMPLIEVNPRAASAYLGPYLKAFLLDLAFQEKVGFFSEPLLRSHVIVFLTNPRVWTDTLKDNLPDDCKAALGHAVKFCLKAAELLALPEEKAQSLERLSRAIDRDLAT
jgi:hypothetical protein